MCSGRDIVRFGQFHNFSSVDFLLSISKDPSIIYKCREIWCSEFPHKISKLKIKKKIMVDMVKKMMMMIVMSMLTVMVVDSSSLVSDSCLNLTEWTVGIHSGKIDRDDVVKNVKRTNIHR